MLAHVVKLCAVAALLLAATVARPDAGTVWSTPLERGLIKVRSLHGVEETVARLRSEIEGRGITVFAQIEQARLAAERGIELRPSVLLLFGNAAIGARLIEANQLAGLDWPVRLLVAEDEAGEVWAIYEDFAQIARRHGIEYRAADLATAARVVASITSAVTER